MSFAANKTAVSRNGNSSCLADADCAADHCKENSGDNPGLCIQMAFSPGATILDTDKNC